MSRHEFVVSVYFFYTITLTLAMFAPVISLVTKVPIPLRVSSIQSVSCTANVGDIYWSFINV